MRCILWRTISYHYQCRFPPTKEEVLLCSTCLELLLGCSRSFLVFLARSPALVVTYSRLLHLLQTTNYKLFWLADLQKMNFMLDIVTKRGKCYYKTGSFLFYKTGLVVLQSRVGITEWHNFYNKMGGEVFQSGAIITKRSRIVQKDSDISVLEPQSLKVKLLESQKIAWRRDIKLWTSLKVNIFFKKKSQSRQNTWKSSSIVILFYGLER